MPGRLGNLFLVADKEFRPLAYFFSLFFLIGCGMAMGRVTADALFFKRYGIEYLPVMYIIVSAGLCLTSILYSAFADRLPAEKFFLYLFGALIVLLLGNWSLIAFSTTTLAYPLYFVIYEIASELLLVHAALYLGQNFETRQAKRLSPLVMGGSQIGVIVGGLFVAGSSRTLGVQNILLLWCALLTASVLLIAIWHHRHGGSPHFRPGRKSADKLGQAVTEVQQGLRLMRTSELLRALSFALFFMVITFYVLCYSVNRIYTSTFDSEESLTIFFGILTSFNSVIALLLQLFVTNRLLRRFGARRVNMIFPVTSLLSYIALLFSFSLPTALFGSFNKDAVLNAFRNPVRNLFFHALPVNIQGRARATSIIVVLPLALTVSGLLLWIMQRMGNPLYFVTLGAIAALVYFYFSFRVSRAYGAEMVAHLKQKLFMPGSDADTFAGANSEAVFEELARGVRHRDNRITLDFARLLISAFPERAAALILERINDVDTSTRDQLFRLLASGHPPELEAYLWKALQSPDGHLRATALQGLAELAPRKALAVLDTALGDENPRIVVAAVAGIMRHGGAEQRARAILTWERLLRSTHTGTQLAVLDLLELLRGRPHTGTLQDAYRNILLSLLDHRSERVVGITVDSLRHWPADGFAGLPERINGLYRDGGPDLRIACLRQCRLLPEADRDALIDAALEDSNPGVRGAAVAAIFATREHAGELLTTWLTTENRGSPRAQHAMLLGLQDTETARPVMQQISLAKAADAEHFARALKILRTQPAGNSAALELLTYALEEKLYQTIDLMLLAMQSLAYQDDIDVVRAGLKSRDPHHVAHALEVLHGMQEQSLARVICNILDDTGSGRPQGGRHANVPFIDLKGVLIWCERRLDPWLRHCAGEALKTFQ